MNVKLRLFYRELFISISIIRVLDTGKLIGSVQQAQGRYDSNLGYMGHKALSIIK